MGLGLGIVVVGTDFAVVILDGPDGIMPRALYLSDDKTLTERHILSDDLGAPLLDVFLHPAHKRPVVEGPHPLAADLEVVPFNSPIS